MREVARGDGDDAEGGKSPACIGHAIKLRANLEKLLIRDNARLRRSVKHPTLRRNMESINSFAKVPR